ncbi:MAG: B12-binding domain-containing radical SAM protein, partial [Deltaproteobacteria bacterium]|nr:B12-binding domain-containing radical SAM protein [Deltaproteobacteria bacterium]
MHELDILLVQPPIRDFYFTAKRSIPYGLGCIAASAASAGFSVEILDALATSKSRPIQLPPEMAYLRPYYGKPDISPFGLFHQFRHYGYSLTHIEQVLRQSGAQLVGISSLFTPYADDALKIAEIAKRVLPTCKVVLGGHHPTTLPEPTMSSQAVDFVIRGEGEWALPALARSLKTGASIQAVPGIVYRKKDGQLHINPPAVINELDQIPWPDASRINRKFYRRKTGGSCVVVASRGCPMQCSYCALGLDSPLPYRRRRPESVIHEIEMQVTRHHVRFIDFEDENLSLDKAWFLEILSGIRDRFGAWDLELRAMNGLYPASLDETVIGAMAAVGFKTLNLSLGTICPDQQLRFQRANVKSAFEQALALAETHGMQAVGYVIASAPGQSATDSISDLLYLTGQRVLAGLSIFYPAPGSRDYARAGKLGLLPAKYSLMRSSALPIDHTTS